MKAKISNLARRLEELEMRKQHEVQAVTEIPVPNKPCFISQSTEHLREQCPTILAMREMFVEQANVVGQFKPSTNAPYGNTYNLVGEITLISHGSQNPTLSTTCSSTLCIDISAITITVNFFN